MNTPNSSTNRNGLIADFESFKPAPRFQGEFVEGAELGRISKTVAEFASSRLVRYRLGSNELKRDAGSNDTSRADYGRSLGEADRIAMFGLIDAKSDKAVALIHVDEEPRIGHAVIFCIPKDDPEPQHEDLLAALRALDVPPVVGAADALADLDIEFDAGTQEWVRKEPVYLVSMQIERICPSTNPPLADTFGMYLLMDEDYPLEPGDEMTNVRSQVHYQDLAMDRWSALAMGGPPRKGFTGWFCRKHPEKVKVVGQFLNEEIARLIEERDLAAAPTMG